MDQWGQWVAFGAFCLTMKGNDETASETMNGQDPERGEKIGQSRRSGSFFGVCSADVCIWGGFFCTPGPAYKNGKLYGIQARVEGGGGE